MAFNPPVNDSGTPMRVEGEYMVLLRKNIEIEVKVQNASGKKAGKGKLFITTARMVFVADKKDPSFSSFDIPFLNIYNEKFEQPIFGANYLHVKVKPLFGLLPGDCDVKLWFMSGGCQKFLKYFIHLLEQIRKRRQDGADPNFIRDLKDGTLDGKFAAYVDPNDPSVVFVSQPEVETKNPEMNNYFAPMQKQVGPQLNSFEQSQPQLSQQPAPSQGIQIGSDIPGYQINQSQHYPTMQAQPQQYQPQGGVIPTDFNSQPNYAPTDFSQNQQGYPGYQQLQQDSSQSQGYPTFSNYNQNPQQPTQPFGQEPGQQSYTGYTQPGLSQEPPQQQQIPQPQPHQWAPPQPSVGYYYGFWGPNLNNNNNRGNAQ